MKNILVVILVMTSISCQRKFEPDFFNHQLPKYTAKGNNFSGCLINNKVWISDSKIGFNGVSTDLMRIYIKNDSVWLALSGELSSKEPIMLAFHLTGFSTFNNNMIEELHDKKIDLAHSMAILLGEGDFGFVDTLAISTKGNLFIRNAKANHPEHDRPIIAGTFGFDAISDSSDITIYSGRFDYSRNFIRIESIDAQYIPSRHRN